MFLQNVYLILFLQFKCEVKAHNEDMNKNISYRSSQLLNALVAQKRDFFTLTDAVTIFADKDYSTIRKLLSDMTKRGVIMRIKEGLYHRIPYE